MIGDAVVTLVGNLVDDPELRFTSSGQAFARFRIASAPRYLDRQANQWKDGESLFLTCSVWRQAAENVVQSLERGMRVVVQGRLCQRCYETKDGETRTTFELEVDEVGPSLRDATVKASKTARVNVPARREASTSGVLSSTTSPPQPSLWADEKVAF